MASLHYLKPKQLQPNIGPSVQPGVDAALSRQRSPVQIRYGSRKKFELRSKKFEISHFELPTSNFIWCGMPTAERLVLEASA